MKRTADRELGLRFRIGESFTWCRVSKLEGAEDEVGRREVETGQEETDMGRRSAELLAGTQDSMVDEESAEEKDAVHGGANGKSEHQKRVTWRGSGAC